MACASSKSVSVDEIEDLLTCSLCLETLNEPRSLPCFHNFCKVCLGRYVESLRGGHKTVEIFPCPNCRSKFTLKSNQDVAELPSIFFIKNLLEILAAQEKAKETIACSRCENPAINHCTSCEVFMCKKCSGSHDGWFTNHQVLPIHEMGSPESQAKMKSKLYCVKHKDKIVEYHCETCKELCCIDCVVLNHQKPKHSCVEVSKLAEKLRGALQQRCTTIDEKLSEGKEVLNNICEVIKRLQKNAATAKKQIKKQKENILKIVAGKLDEKEREINNEVDKVYGEMYSELNRQHDEIKEYLDNVQASVSLPSNLLKRGSVEEILSSQKLIDEKIEKLGNEKPEDIVAVNDGSIQYIPVDIGNINVDEVVGKMGHVKDSVSAMCNLKKSSSILKEEIVFMNQLHKWLGKKCKWNLCYRASRDGWRAQDFHRHCDNKGPTVVLVKANDCIFGGYTDQHWESISGFGAYKRSNTSFLFSLRNKDNLAPFIANIKQGQEQYAIYCNSGSGPVFGGGNDICIFDNPQTNQSSNFGFTYQLPPGYVYGSEQAKNLLAGQYWFLTTEIEVFN